MKNRIVVGTVLILLLANILSFRINIYHVGSELHADRSLYATITGEGKLKCKKEHAIRVLDQ